MTTTRPLLDVLHDATHRVPGVPGHARQAAGHHGTTHHGTTHHGTTHHGKTHHGRTARRGPNHSPARPPRVLVAWQRRIAALFGQQL